MLSWLKRRKWLVANAILVGVLVSLLGIQVVDKGDVVDYSVKIGIGEEKVITLGHIAYAAGSVDYTYDGTDDDVQFQAALDALPATGGRLVVVSAVQISFSSTVSRAIDNVIIEGSGDGTYFVNDGATAIFDAGVQSGWQFRNFRTDAGFIDIDSTTDYIIENVTNDTTLVGKAVRTSTLVVAASNATDTVKAQADYVCDGTADQVEIQAAIDALPSGGGKVVLGEGTFNLNATVEVVTGQDDITIEGNKAILTMSSSPTEALTSDSGVSTSIEVADSSSFSVGMDVWIRDDTTYDNSSDYRTISAIPDSTHITIDSNTSADWQTANNASITGICRYINIEDATEADYVKKTTIRGITFDGAESTVSIKGSWQVPMLRLRCVDGAVVDDCYFKNSDTCGLFMGKGKATTSNCYFENFKAADAVNGFDTLHIGGDSQLTVVGNHFRTIASDNGIYFCQSVNGSIISGNDIECTTDCSYPIYISNANDVSNLIIGNTIQGGSWGIRCNGNYNTIMGNTVIFPDTSSGTGIVCYGDKNKLVGNHVYKGSEGYRLRDADYCTMYACTAEASATGLKLKNTDYSRVEVCDFATCTTKVDLTSDDNTNYTLRNIAGYVTENSGLSGNVTLDASGIGAIAHGCDATPTYANVICQSANYNVRISSIDATNINIYVFDLDNAAVTADTHDFYWEAKVR